MFNKLIIAATIAIASFSSANAAEKVIKFEDLKLEDQKEWVMTFKFFEGQSESDESLNARLQKCTVKFSITNDEYFTRALSCPGYPRDQIYTTRITK